MNQFPHKISAKAPGEIATGTDLPTFLATGRYQGYTYAYPHKTAYRWFEEPIPLRDVWAAQSLQSTFLYAHIPFCEMRCGFCNLFTTTHPVEEREHAFIDALIRQAQIVRQNLPEPPVITSGAIGGGTPTILSETNLERLFRLLAETFGFDYRSVPFSVETSPETATSEKIAILENYSVQRASIGVQSWFAEELRAMGRPQDVRQTHQAVSRLRASTVDRLNIDLIYGAHGQTSETMAANIAETLLHEPDEIFLYPLYVRPLTGLGRNSLRSWDDDRVNQYRTGRDALLEAGFRQTSMRRFEKTAGLPIEQSESFPLEARFECQTDPTIGLGPGARSYTTSLHYSSDWAVSREQVGSIIDTFIGATAAELQSAAYGVQLTEDDRKRRFALQGLLQTPGLSFRDYVELFGSTPFEDFDKLSDLVQAEFAELDEDILCLTKEGLEYSDAIGPWLYSPTVIQQMSSFVTR